MHYADYLPTRDMDFLSWTDNFLKYLPDLLEKTGFPVEVYQQLTAAYDNFAEKYYTSVSPVTRTSGAVTEKNTARKALEQSIRQAVRTYLNFNPALSNANRSDLGMRVYKTTRTRIPVPETIPHFTIKPVAGCRLEVRFLEPGKSNRHHNAKPFGVHGAFIIWAVLPEAPASFNDLGHSQSAARSPIYLHFDFADAGKRCYIAICWENTRSERGPWSAIKSATIPD